MSERVKSAETGRSATAAPGPFFEAAIRSSIDPIAFVDVRGRVDYVNGSLLRMWGFENDSCVLGRHLSALVETAHDIDSILARLTREGGWRGEAVARKPTGERFIVEAAWTPVKDAAGLAIGAMATFIDLTARKRTEEALQDSEERYRSLVESALDPIFRSDETGRFLYVNVAAAAQLGTTPEHIIGKTVDDLFPPHVAQGYRAGVRSVIETGKTEISENLSEVNGRQVWYSTILQPVRDRHGRITAAQAVVRDITNLKEAERALRESEERLRQAVRVADIGIFDHDHRTGEIYMSPQQRTICGLEPDEPVHASDILPNLIHTDDRARVGPAIQRAHRGESGGLLDIEHRIVRRDGSVRTITMRSQTSFEGDGDRRRPVRTVGAVRDITDRTLAAEEREKLQAQLSHAQKLESIGRLAGGVAHDFNNMLNVIQGYAELVLEQLDPAQPVAVALQEVQKAAERSADLTRQLLGFARRQNVVPKVLNLNDVVERSLNMLRRLIGENIEPIWTPGAKLWSVQIDPTQVDQILVNLSANARDAITGAGKITIRTENVSLDNAECAELGGTAPGEYVMLSVTDDGRGMDVETQAHIFEPFYTTKSEGHGTGLGLATVYGIVKQNNGFITAASELGRGTTVQIFLPRVAASPARAGTDDQIAAPTTGTETVLLVEDETMVLRFCRRLLEKLGYRVLAANTPAEAFRLAEEQAGRIHLLLTDIVMPEMNGPELAEQLLLRYPQLKCLFVSGYFSNASSPVANFERGAHFLQKPYSLNDLAAKVREALES